jgi:murein DD-endopeptidase MepM/ murein hydrolase activator NlpD
MHRLHRGLAALTVLSLLTVIPSGSATAARRRRARPARPAPEYMLLFPIVEAENVKPATVAADTQSLLLPPPATTDPTLPALSPDDATPDAEAPLPPAETPLESTEAQAGPAPYVPQASTNSFPWFIFPVAGKVWWNDWFNPDGLRPMRIHHGQDIFAPKMTPLVAVFDGVVWLRPASHPGGHNMLYLYGDNGLQARYMHINNDTPGTDDGNGGWEKAYAPGLNDGDRVAAGQHVAWVGDSGNAENTDPHLHFELWSEQGCLNPEIALRESNARGTLRTSLQPMPIGKRPTECRWDGIVDHFDKSSGVAIFDLTANVIPTGQGLIVPRPRKMWARFTEATRVVTPSGAPAEAELSAGDRIAIIGEDPGNGRAIMSRVAAITRLSTAKSGVGGKVASLR